MPRRRRGDRLPVLRRGLAPPRATRTVPFSLGLAVVVGAGICLSVGPVGGPVAQARDGPSVTERLGGVPQGDVGGGGHRAHGHLAAPLHPPLTPQHRHDHCGHVSPTTELAACLSSSETERIKHGCGRISGTCPRKQRTSAVLTG